MSAGGANGTEHPTANGGRRRVGRMIFTGLGCGAVPFPSGADGTWRVKVVQAEDALGRMTTMTTRWRKGRT